MRGGTTRFVVQRARTCDGMHDDVNVCSSDLDVFRSPIISMIMIAYIIRCLVLLSQPSINDTDNGDSRPCRRPDYHSHSNTRSSKCLDLLDSSIANGDRVDLFVYV